MSGGVEQDQVGCGERGRRLGHHTLGQRALVSGGPDEPRLLPVHVALDLVVHVDHHLGLVKTGVRQ